jgi:serine/threonine protein kinase
MHSYHYIQTVILLFNLCYFYRVKYAVNTDTNEAVAIKILDKDKIQSRNMGAQIKKEISKMKMISHHHVVSVKDVFATSAKIFIVLEFVGGGELFDKIANEGEWVRAIPKFIQACIT